MVPTACISLLFVPPCVVIVVEKTGCGISLPPPGTYCGIHDMYIVPTAHLPGVPISLFNDVEKMGLWVALPRGLRGYCRHSIDMSIHKSCSRAVCSVEFVRAFVY